MDRFDHRIPRRIVLTGFMGSGKSTVGAQLAASLGWPFVDLDEEIVVAQGASISSMFESIGELAFRELECAALSKILQRNNIVLALGGGALESESSRWLLRGDPATLSIYLEAPLQILLARCERQLLLDPDAPRRPVFENRDALADRFLRRRPFYEAAHWQIATAPRSPTEVVSDILAQWERLLERGNPGSLGENSS